MKWSDITREDVLEAIRRFLAHTPEYPNPKHTFLLYEGQKFPAKHIRGMAYEVHFQEKAYKSDFTGGKETANFFLSLGFAVKFKGEVLMPTNNPLNSVVSSKGKEEAEEELRKVPAVKHDTILQSGNINLKIAMYLQTENYWNNKAFTAAMKKVSTSNIDILVFPEIGWYPFDFQTVSVEQERNVEAAYRYALSLSQELGCAVVLGSQDADDAIFSLYANAFADADDTKTHIYVKHTATNYSAFEFEDYRKRMKQIFEPIRYKGYKIGLTICYDCNHAIFSRIYGLQGVDVILNGTGGNVRHEQWRKYNKARAIENHCYTLVTMGGWENRDDNYVFGFNREGGELPYRALWGKSSQSNIPGMIYIYDLSQATKNGEADIRLFQKETVCALQMLHFPVGHSKKFLDKSKQVKEKIYIRSEGDMTLVVIVADNEDIMLPEKHLPLLYDSALRDYPNKRYLILCRYENLEETFYREKLSVILKVRAMENYSAVIFESSNHTGCYLPGQMRNVQAVKGEDGVYGLDANRMKGPELIWRNRKLPSMKESWRDNLEWLIGTVESSH